MSYTVQLLNRSQPIPTYASLTSGENNLICDICEKVIEQMDETMTLCHVRNHTFHLICGQRLKNQDKPCPVCESGEGAMEQKPLLRRCAVIGCLAVTFIGLAAAGIAGFVVASG